MNYVRLLALILSIIIFVNATPAYFPEERSGHTAVLVENKLYFLGGKDNYGQRTNDFFYLDVSKPFLITNLSFLPFHDLSYLSTTLPPHQRGTASLCGNKSIYFFGGERDLSNKQDSLIYTFNTVSQQWSHPKINGNEPNIRKQLASTCDSKGRIKSVSNLTPESNNGFSATMLKDGIIAYIGGRNNNGYHDMSKIMLYNTNTASWSVMDDRILIWGGENDGLPVEPQLAVLDSHFIWSIPDITGVKNSIEILPYYAHTATMIDDYMVIAFGLTYDKFHNMEIASNRIFLLYTPNQYHYEWNSVFIPSILSDASLTNFEPPPIPSPIPPISSPDDPIERPTFALDALIVVLFLVGALIGFAAWYLYKHYPEIRNRAGYTLLPTNDFWNRGLWEAD
ncbi:13874_t:CDS:2 [Dentiscutata heterogama]|uniref:13874_t:CDS:1 n=1 Tax=Dentiscutata heterogama TaxID=1316150 RepID=A0ACA9LC11_9GLOM|nr:13874_t:CDS:2 [Dentiscutata heterogama]